MDNLQVNAALHIYLHYALKNQQNKEDGGKQLYREREEHSEKILLVDLKFQALNGQYKSFTRM